MRAGATYPVTRWAAAALAVAAVVVAAVVVATVGGDGPDDVTAAIRTADAAIMSVDEAGLPGCVATVPPDPDPCIAARQTIAYAVLGNLVNSSQLAAWRKANPGEWSRLTSYMTSGGTSPPGMLTPMGGALVAITQAYYYARGSAPLAWPAPNPPLDPKRADKKPPSSPSGLTVTPG